MALLHGFFDCAVVLMGVHTIRKGAQGDIGTKLNEETLHLFCQNVPQCELSDARGVDHPARLAIDGSGAIYALGRSSSVDFPVTAAQSQQPKEGRRKEARGVARR